MSNNEYISRFQKLGINLTGNERSPHKMFCPRCHETRKNKTDKSLSINIEDGLFNCHNCMWSGSVKTKVEQKDYVIPKINFTDLSEKTLQYFNKRGINQLTIKDWQITESGDADKWINFNYFENGKPINIKFRNAKKEFRMVKDAKLIFYGIDKIKDNDRCAITEGEFDALAFYEAGIKSVCSVPNGASSGNNELTYLDNCWQYFENKKMIIIATDTDSPGQSLKKELSRRLGADRCYQMDFSGCKDANEVLIKYGPAKLRELYEKATPIPLEGITTLTEFEDELDSIYIDGYPKGAKTGWKDFDNHLQFMGGQFTMITGIPGDGKSEWMDNLAVRLNKVNGWKFGVFTPENAPLHYHASKLIEKIQMKRIHGSNRMSEYEFALGKVDVLDNFYWINLNNDDLSITGILNKFKELIIRYGIKAGIIDPWNQLENRIPHGMTETQFIGSSLYEVMNFCLKYDFHCFIIAHPTKLKRGDDGKYLAPGLYDISGSSHFFNKTYNGITVYRDYGSAHDDYLDDIKIIIQKVKFKWCGHIGQIEFQLNKKTTQYEEKFTKIPSSPYSD